MPKQNGKNQHQKKDKQNNLNESFRTEFSETIEFSPQKNKKNKKNKDI